MISVAVALCKRSSPLPRIGHFQNFHRMHDANRLGACAQVGGDLGEAADVASGDPACTSLADGGGFAVAQIVGDFRLIHVVGACGAAADFAIRNLYDGDAGNGTEQFAGGGAHALGVAPSRCIGVEDAVAGITAIHAAGMPAIGIGDVGSLSHADQVFTDIASIPIETLLGVSHLAVEKYLIHA